MGWGTHWSPFGDRASCGSTEGHYTPFMSAVTCRACASCVQEALIEVERTLPDVLEAAGVRFAQGTETGFGFRVPMPEDDEAWS